ncbi:MAG: hypothetical protein K6L75_06315 [Cellvibrionaceae bacterium]
MANEVEVHEAAAQAVEKFGPLLAWINFVGYYSEDRAVDLDFAKFNVEPSSPKACQ